MHDLCVYIEFVRVAMTLLIYEEYCVASYNGLAIDVGRQKLYYADDAAGSGKLGELSTDGTGHRVLISDEDSGPRGVVIDVDNRSQHTTHFHVRVYATMQIF